MRTPSASSTTSGCVSVEREADLHRAAGHRDPQGVAALDAALRRHALERGGDRRLHPAVDLGEPPAQLGLPDHVRPELEEGGEPAVVAVDATGGVGRDPVEPGRDVAGKQLAHLRLRRRAPPYTAKNRSSLDAKLRQTAPLV